jgi:alpha-L-arabinofuranosidase
MVVSQRSPSTRTPARTRRATAGGTALAAVLALSAAAAVAGVASPGQPSGSTTGGHHVVHHRPAPVRTVVRVDARAYRGRASRLLLGINHHYNANGYGFWDPATDSARQVVVREARRAGVQLMRYPGGSVAIPYDWRKAIGPERGCQVDGNHPGKTGIHHAQTRRLQYGPDEYMTSLRQLHARPLIMVPSMISTPQAAADWVEYMNVPSGTEANPGGGVDWAEVRAANGHPASYGVRWWEVGNEPMHINSRYWMSLRDAVAVRQYAFGGSVRIRHEWLGRNCAHPARGSHSDGTAGQVFDTLYPPVKRGSVRLMIGTRTWTEVPTLTGHGAHAHVYTLAPESGRVTFGDGVHGAIPGRGAHVRAWYTSVHQGFFDFAAAMKAVDPGIRVCASWGRPLFLQVTRGHHLDCLTDHPVTSYRLRQWSQKLQGHDQMMLDADRRRDGVADVRAALPARTPLLLTEFSVLRGNWDVYPTWASSCSEAVYMSTEWASWLRQHIAIGTGGDLIWTSNRAAFGSRWTFTYSAEAVTRQAIKPMFHSGGRVLRTSIAHNPVRTAALPSHGRYPALVVAATRTPSGDVLLMVVNRLPTQAVRARIAVSHRHLPRRAHLRAVYGRSYSSANLDGRPPSVTLHRYAVRIGRDGLVLRFPAASTTLIRLTKP